ncbi:uncharacterized protein B0T23DRAFT_47087 [Neurospora hispaniola]|uniref:BZIP domain-containing protein n=1 Tax=Neurospora hispaniola TaxID=588809 RepID=A0AAJ0HZ87_9PEZI|nr:hypothetical protein B0T23DRAFT_47087 [Neurospora hispaniola]
MRHPLSLRFFANFTITILLACNIVSAFHVEDFLYTLRSLKDAPSGSAVLNARSSNLTAPASAPASNGTVGSSHPDSTDKKEWGLGIGGLLHNLFGRHDTSTAITLNIRASNGTVTPAGVSNGTILGGASHPDAATKGDHGSLGLGDLLHKIFNYHNTPTIPGPLAGRSSNSTVLPAAVSNSTVPTGSSHPDAATDKGQGLGLGNLLSKIFGRSKPVPVSVEPEDVDEVDGEVGMLMSLNRRAKKDGENRLSREERRKNREKRRVRRAMSAATESKKEERQIARSRVFRG